MKSSTKNSEIKLHRLLVFDCLCMDVQYMYVAIGEVSQIEIQLVFLLKNTPCLLTCLSHEYLLLLYYSYFPIMYYKLIMINKIQHKAICIKQNCYDCSLTPCLIKNDCYNQGSFQSSFEDSQECFLVCSRSTWKDKPLE